MEFPKGTDFALQNLNTTMQQHKTVTFCCTVLPPKKVDLDARGGIDALNAKNDEVYRNVKLKRNRMRSAQRAHEQRAYCRLRELVPSLQSQQRKASKLETLKHTCAYIRYLKEILEKLQMIKLQRDETEKSKEGDNLAKAGVIGEVPRNNELTC